MPLSLKAINNELARRGHQVLFDKGDGYFYFWSGEAVDWLDRTVRVPTLHSLTLEQSIEEFRKLKKKNQDLLKTSMNERNFKKHLEELAAGKPELEHTHGTDAVVAKPRPHRNKRTQASDQSNSARKTKRSRK